MIEYKKSNYSGKYFAIQIFECPIEVLLFAANFGSDNVLIENYNNARTPNSLQIFLKNNNSVIEPRVQKIVADFHISKLEFLLLQNIWDTQGCYAVFYEGKSIPFKVTDLQPLARYTALDNFKWSLEIAIPSGASDGWGKIASPNIKIIDEIESYLKSIH